MSIASFTVSLCAKGAPGSVSIPKIYLVNDIANQNQNFKVTLRTTNGQTIDATLSRRGETFDYSTADGGVSVSDITIKTSDGKTSRTLSVGGKKTCKIVGGPDVASLSVAP